MATEVPVPINTGTGPTQAATIVDSQNSFHQQVVIETQSGSADPSPVSAANPLPVNVVLGGAVGGTSANYSAPFPGAGTAAGFLDVTGTLMKPAQLDASNNVKVNIAAGGVQAVVDNSTGFTSGSTQAMAASGAYNDSASAVVSGNMAIPRITANRQWRMVLDAASNGGWTRYSAIQPGTPAKAVLKATAGQVGFIQVVNLNAGAVFLRFWDALTGAVTLGTTPSTDMWVVPGNAAGAGFAIPLSPGMVFANGIIVAVTGLIGTTDNTAIAGNSVVVNIGYA